MESPDGRKWRSNFDRMAIAFALCQATVTTPIGFATSLLDPTVGRIGTGGLYLATIFSSLLMGAPVVTALGAKISLVIAMSCSTTYAMLFALATLQAKGSIEQWVAYLVGAVLSGCGSGILWTAQGVFLTDSSALIAASEDHPEAGTQKQREAVTAVLGGSFASKLLVVEILVKLSASLLQGSFLQWKLTKPLLGLSTMFFLFASIAAAMVVATALLVVVPTKRDSPAKSARRGCGDGVMAAFRLWPDVKIWCLAFTNLTFGFCAGYMNGFVNGSFTTPNPTLGPGSLGTLLALTCLVASIASKLFGSLSKKVGKRIVICIGAACFATIPISVLLFTPSEANGYWGASLVALYVLQGMGRAVYESTNKAVFADFFPGAQSAGAYANCMMQNSFAFFVSFILQSVLSSSHKSYLAWIVLALAVATAPGFEFALNRQKREQQASGRASLLGQ
eukprot:TRINITY_DN18956_c0_g1_i1.p1 TRINITY_DN18956_c0_g1~~TRINITY_DN18956_c0_g1_i1.p1  ORF type:complete len:450 (-),score=43.41 TRINITY_DN18956_c0_g1_i1:29-1378(-)